MQKDKNYIGKLITKLYAFVHEKAIETFYNEGFYGFFVFCVRVHTT